MENKDLFNYRKTGIVSCDNVSVGTSGIAGLNGSKYKTTRTAPKISLAAFIMDLIFLQPGKWAAYKTSTDDIYLEFADGTRYFRTISEYQYDEGSDPHHRFHAVCEVIHQLLFNEELRDVFKEIKLEQKTSGSYSRDKLFKFCDSFYYYNVNAGGTFPSDALLDVASLESIKAAFRSGEMQRLDYLLPDMGKSEFEVQSTPAKKAVRKNKKTTDFVKECKDGKYRIAYEWPKELKAYIKKPEYLDTFETTPEFEEIVRKIKFRADRILERMDMGYTGAEAIGKDALNILLLGKPGTGKTALAYALSAATGMPVCTTAWNKHSEEGEVEGKSRIVDGKPAFVETDSLLFHQFGGIDINEEINLADPSVTMGCLGQKLEYPFIVKKNGFETVTRHPLNVIIGTMNVGTNGSNPLNQALANRFNTPYILDDPTKETFINILEKVTKTSRDVCTWVYDAYEATVNYLKSPAVNEDEICQNLSIRTCVGAIENLEEGQSPQRALINSIVGAVAVVDLEVARNLQKETIENLAEPAFSF
nr:AAA family ATPase [uncultured Butyrivibrio sp.]